MKITPKLYNIKVEGNCKDYGKKTESEFHKEQEVYSKFDFLQLLPFDPSNDYTPQLIKDEFVVVGEDQLLALSIKNIRFKVAQEINVSVDITKQLVDLAEKPIAISMNSGGDNNYNTKCEVHIPNISMLMYNELMLSEDVCTDELQAQLNSGWRIIAVCPQPDQRRPDYILGRFNPDMHDSASAKRN